MFLFLFIFNFFLSFSLSQNLGGPRMIYIENENFPFRQLATKKEKTKPFICVEKKNTTEFDDEDTEEYERVLCVLDHTTCTKYDSTEPCYCKKEYATRENDNVYCDYTRKKQLVAFLLELFVGFGSGHFYRGEYLMASLKLAAFVFGIYIICLFPLTVKCFDSCCESDCCIIIISIFFFLCSVGLAFWFIFDLVRFGKNKYLDHEGVEFLKW